MLDLFGNRETNDQRDVRCFIITKYVYHKKGDLLYHENKLLGTIFDLI